MSEHRPTTNGASAGGTLDERLRRRFRPPTEDRLAAIARTALREAAAAAPPPAPLRPRVFRRLAVAASLVGAVAGLWLIGRIVTGPTPGDGYAPPPWTSLETAYLDWMAEGFEPMWVCADDREFADTFRTNYHQGLLLDDLPAGTVALGLSYCHTLSTRTTALLATVDGVPVVVFVDRIERDADQPAPEGLHRHRRRLGRLVLYELSPLEQPAVLPWFVNPDAGGG